MIAIKKKSVKGIRIPVGVCGRSGRQKGEKIFSVYSILKRESSRPVLFLTSEIVMILDSSPFT